MATTKAVAKKVTKKRELVEKHYRWLNYQPLTATLNAGVGKNPLLIYDDETNRNRAIRHCPGEPSIYVDEQSAKAVAKPIIFLNGLLETGPRDTFTQDFLDAHPSNGIKFELIDEGADAEEFADAEELKMDVKAAIRAKAREEGGIEELRIIVSVLENNVAKAAKLSPPEIKTNLYDLVDSNVNRFVDEGGKVTIFDDQEIKRLAISQHAFNSGVIEVSADGYKVIWTDNKGTICMIPTGQDHKEYFAKYLGTEDGMKVAMEISKR